MREALQRNFEFTIKQHGGDGWGVKPFLTKIAQKNRESYGNFKCKVCDLRFNHCPI